MSISYQDSKNWKAPAIKYSTSLSVCNKDSGHTDSVNPHQPTKVPAGMESDSLPGTPPPDIRDQPYDGSAK